MSSIQERLKAIEENVSIDELMTILIKKHIKDLSNEVIDELLIDFKEYFHFKNKGFEFKDFILTNNVWIHCKNEKQAEILLEWAERNGGRFKDKLYTYQAYKENTCYNLENFRYAPIDYIINKKNDLLLSFQDALK